MDVIIRRQFEGKISDLASILEPLLEYIMVFIVLGDCLEKSHLSSHPRSLRDYKAGLNQPVAVIRKCPPCQWFSSDAFATLKVLLPEVAGQNLAFLLHNLVKHPMILRKVIENGNSSCIFSSP
jgi:hypothetical protein